MVEYSYYDDRSVGGSYFRKLIFEKVYSVVFAFFDLLRITKNGGHQTFWINTESLLKSHSNSVRTATGQ